METREEQELAAVKQLRDKTGFGMMDCRMALKYSDGDAEKAEAWLQSRGKSHAVFSDTFSWHSR
jgi:translation elongation factor EF-Ts